MLKGFISDDIVYTKKAKKKIGEYITRKIKKSVKTRRE